MRDLAPLIQFKRPQLDATRRRLDAAYTIEDLRRIAKRRTPKAAFDYTDGAAEDEISLLRARQAFRDIEFHPTILRDVSNVTAGWNVLGIDFSAEAVALARRDLGAEAGRVRQADFFSPIAEAPFQTVYERAFLCARPRRLWPDWGRRVAQLARPRGELAGFC